MRSIEIVRTINGMNGIKFWSNLISTGCYIFVIVCVALVNMMSVTCSECCTTIKYLNLLFYFTINIVFFRRTRRFYSIFNSIFIYSEKYYVGTMQFCKCKWQCDARSSHSVVVVVFLFFSSLLSLSQKNCSIPLRFY